MYQWELALPEVVSLENGWISIQSTSCQDGSWFLWAGSPEGNLNAIQDGGSTGDNLAFTLRGFFAPYHDVKVEDILQPLSGPAGVIAPIINVSNIGACYVDTFELTVKIISSTLEYYQSCNVTLHPSQSTHVILPEWTPAAWHTIENPSINYTIIATAYLNSDNNQSDNVKTQSFTLTYPCDLHRMVLFGVISERTHDVASTSFQAKHVVCYDLTTSNITRLTSDETIIVAKEHQAGFVGRRIIIGIFDGIVFSTKVIS
jgi:hypothetical protein